MALATATPVGAAGTEVRERIIAASLRCVARFGLTKLTLDDVAREAGCSRATVYRYFSNKAALFSAVVASETDRMCRGLDEAVDGAATLEDLVTAATAYGARELSRHEALQFLLRVEPEAVLPYVCFSGAERMLAHVAAALAPHLGRFLPPTEAARVGEWIGRVFLSYGFEVPFAGEAEIIALVRDFVLPGLTSRRSS
jgi:AcrR family transcriptional regulator